jgi:hypothetical protein
MGKLYVDVHGKLEATNLTKNIKAELNITRQGWTARNAYKVEGKGMDVNGDTKFEVSGRWNESLSIKDLSTGREEVIWNVDPKPTNADRMYGFGMYTINLNYMDEDMKKYLPPTDTRRRND